MSAEPALVLFRVGRAFSQGHNPGAAVRYFERALALAPGRPEIEYALGESLMDAGRPADAVPHLRIAIANGVRADVAGVDLVRSLAAAGDRAGALEALATVTPSNPADADSWLALGNLAVLLQAPDLQVRFFGRAAAAAPSNPTAHLNLAVALAETGRLDEAKRHAEEALRLKPDYENAQRLLDALERR
jgi:tetratricopeptide (TPR) repeat protein